MGAVHARAPPHGRRRDHPLGHPRALFPAHGDPGCRAGRHADQRGQRVGLFYSSANFDEDVFDRPFEFDISRDPKSTPAFGGNGAHYCIGANLARMEIKLIFDQIAEQIPDISKLAEPTRLRSRAGSTESKSCGSPIASIARSGRPRSKVPSCAPTVGQEPNRPPTRRPSRGSWRRRARPSRSAATTSPSPMSPARSG